MLGIYNFLIVCIIIVCISSTNWLQILFNKLTYLLLTYLREARIISANV